MHHRLIVPRGRNTRPYPIRRSAIVALGVWAVTTIPAGAAPPAAGSIPTPATITVERPWSRATPGGSTVAIGYLTIRNTGDASDRLVAATTDVARRSGPHSMTMTNGVMEMRPMTQGIVIPPHGTAVLAPGGDHLMLEDIKHPLRKGDRFAGTLVFEHAGTVPVTFTVEAIGAKGPAASGPAGGPGTADGTPGTIHRADEPTRQGEQTR